MSISIRQLSALHEVGPNRWNPLVEQHDNPFLRYEFLAGLENHRCLDGHGWYPCHVIAEEGNRLAGALPLYLKTNSIGEFIFDWSWADAYERAGGQYYPKLVSAIPFTPVTGPRFLVHPDFNNPFEIANALLEKAMEFARENGYSGLHVLFPGRQDREFMTEQNILMRKNCQYHWFNNNYSSFNDFLTRLTSRKRKKVKHERQQVHAEDITIEILQGMDITPEIWEIYHGFYRSTFYRKWGEPRLTLDFFLALGRNMPENTLLFMAKHSNEYVAGAFAMRGDDTLFGRHWGCSRHYRFLHFELCYYQTIEYCIRHGLATLDAGVQGEHKLSRGFVPVRCWSGHWIRDNNFHDAISGFLDYEDNAIEDYINEIQQHLAYKAA